LRLHRKDSSLKEDFEMQSPAILLVSSDPKEIKQISAAFAELSLPHPEIREDGHSAALWAGAHECHLCVMRYELPDMDGLAAMAALRQRNPDVPIIMISGADSEEIAVSAFRKGVTDYVPESGDVARVTAVRVGRFLDSLEQNYVSTLEHTNDVFQDALTDPDLSGVPAHRLRPTYQNRLRIVGRQIDIEDQRDIFLFEVNGGFILRSLASHSRLPEALEFNDRDFPSLLKASLDDQGTGEPMAESPHSLLPTGYQDFLRALGYQLDDMLAEAIAIMELPESIVVSGLYKNEATLGTHIEEFELHLDRNEIEYMLNEAYRRRGSATGQDLIETRSNTTPLQQILKRLN
jgi:CheY-like chemotaxis protein